MTHDRTRLAGKYAAPARLLASALLLAMSAPVLAVQANAAPAPENKPATVGDAAEKVGDTVERVVERPLKDFNIMKPKRKLDLEAVMDDPYSLKGLHNCNQYRAEVAKMTRSLGPDVDAPEAGDKSLAATRAEFALGTGEAVANSFIPGGGLIRQISGAAKREKYATAAVFAGSLRRAYIKGLMHGKNCR
jgi:hypothetical protein